MRRQALAVYELTDYLVERKRITLSEPVGATARWTYAFNVATPGMGGIALSMTLMVDGTPDPGITLPNKLKIIAVGERR
jgi:hypothetical protein